MNTTSAVLQQERARAGGWPWHWSLLAISMAALFWKVLWQLSVDWWKNPDYSHGLLVPFVIAFVYWGERKEMAALPWRRSNWGMAFACAGVATYLVGILGAEFFLQRFSILMVVSGGVLFLYGWRHLRRCVFGLTLAFLAIPIPSIIFNSVSVPLQLLASSWAEAALGFAHVPVYREGNILQLANQTLNVAEACSGIRSLVSLITLAVMLVHFVRMRRRYALLVVSSSVLIALLFNAFRIAGTGILANVWGERAAEGFFHTFSGWVVFVSAFAVLLLECRLIKRFSRERSAA